MPSNVRTADFLKECISDALYRLLREKAFHKITVEDIVATAGVGRATYFRHFSSKEAALQFKICRLWDRYCDRHGVVNRDRFDMANARLFFDFNYEIRGYLRLLYQTGLENVLFDVFIGIMLPENIHSDHWYREKFYSYGLYGLLDGWIRKDFYETPEHMEETFLRIMADGAGPVSPCPPGGNQSAPAAGKFAL